MIRCARLNCPAGSHVRIKDPFDLPHVLPLSVALEAASAPDDVIVWTDPESGMVGLFHSRGRTAWPLARIVVANAVVLRPDAGPGAVGIEVGLDGISEEPVLSSRPFQEHMATWLDGQRALLAEFFGIAVSWRDYGLDR